MYVFFFPVATKFVDSIVNNRIKSKTCWEGNRSRLMNTTDLQTIQIMLYLKTINSSMHISSLFVRIAKKRRYINTILRGFWHFEKTLVALTPPYLVLGAISSTLQPSFSYINLNNQNFIQISTQHFIIHSLYTQKKQILFLYKYFGENILCLIYGYFSNINFKCLPPKHNQVTS